MFSITMLACNYFSTLKSVRIAPLIEFRIAAGELVGFSLNK
jgi:hypothetical protein